MDEAQLYQVLARENCAFFASEYLRGPAGPPYNGKFFASDHHLEWADHLNKYDRLSIIAARSHGKCRTRSAHITLANGQRHRIEDLANTRPELLALDVTTMRWQKAAAHVEAASAPVPCLRIRTRTGREAEVTVEHPFLAWAGWTEARELRVGQRIAVPKRLAALGSELVDRAWLLGVFVGDGCITAGTHISKAEPSMRDAIVEEVERCGWSAERTTTEIRISADYAQRGDTPRNWLRAHGLYGCDSREKRVPQAIFAARDEDIAQFISGLVDTDCHMNMHDGGSVEFFSVSKELMRDVQHLLVRLGVIAVLAPKNGTYDGLPHESWRLTVRGAEILTLASWVTPRSSPRREALRLVVEHQETKSPRSGIDLFPVEAWDLLEHDSSWFRRRGLTGPTRAHAPTRGKLIRHALAEGNEWLLAVAQADVLWDEIVEISDIGLQPVYPVHVPGPENYVADDFIDHNSFFFTFAYPIWQATRHPNRAGFIFSASQPQAEEILIRIMREVEANPKLVSLKPNTAGMKANPRWSAKTLEFANGFTLHARGYGTKVRGGHPVFIALDDVLNDEVQYSEVVRTKQNDYFFSAVTPMIEPDGQIVSVGTPQHAKDLLGVLKTTQGYRTFEYPAVRPDGTALWPERYPIEKLEEIRNEIKNLRFSREYLCQAVTDTSSMFPLSMFQGAPVEQFNVRLGSPLKVWNELGIRNRFMGVDFAMSRNTGADFTVVFVMGVDNFGNRWVMDILREQGLEFGAQKSLITNAARKYKVDLIFCESNQMQRIFGDELVKESDLPVKPFYTGANKHSLETGVPALAVLLENRKFRIPRGDEYSVDMTNIWISELRSFTFANGRVMSIGAHDDCAMSSWICDQAIRQGGFSFTFDEEPEDAVAAAEEEKLADEEAADPWSDFVPGAVPRVGRPIVMNGRPVDEEDIDDDLDNPRNAHREPKKHGPKQATVDWRPKDGAPMALDILGWR